MHKKEYKVSKWLTSAGLFGVEEFQALLQELGDFLIFPTGELVHSFEAKSHNVWIEEYAAYIDGLKTGAFKKLQPLLMTYDKEDVYAISPREGKYLIYPQYPVIQIREHQFAITRDNRVHSMVFGTESIRWGLIFSYPQIFYDPIEKRVVEVLKERESANTQGFRKLQKWMRDYTRPASFVLGGKKVNATFRVGIQWKEQNEFITN